MTTPIPQPPGVPLLGNIFDIDPSNTWTSLQKLWEKYGEIFKITVLGQQIVFIGSVALCEEICDEKRFRKFVGGPIVEIRYAVHDSLFTAYDNEASWPVHHRLLRPTLTAEFVREHCFAEVRDTVIELTRERWGKSGDGKVVSAISEINRLDIETTTSCFYGRKLGCLEPGSPEPRMIKAMDGATGEAVKRPTRPKFLNWLVYGSKFKRESGAMREYAQECVDHRKKNPTDRKDMLYTMLHAKDPETGKSLTDSQVIDEIVTMPIGSSTAPCVIATAIYYLLKNPDCITKARQEIDSVIGNDITAFSPHHLDQLPYCQGIIRETLRLSAAAPGFNIEPIPSTSSNKQPITLAGGKYQVPHNQAMIIVLHGVNRDPAVYDDPERFNPDRMVGERFDALPEGAKKFFGNGKRVCIGKDYAWMWNLVTIAVLLKEVDFEMGDPAYELRQDGWFNQRPVGFDVRVRKRVL